MQYTPAQAVDILRPLLCSGKLCIFVGSGVSTFPPSGLPTWDGLLDAFIDFCKDQESVVDDPKFSELLKHVAKSKRKYPIQTVSALRDHLEPLFRNSKYTIRHGFQTWFVRLFTAKPNASHRHIVGTAYPYVITSNYDDLLEEAAKTAKYASLSKRSYSFNDVEGLSIALYQDNPCIVHAHGRTTDVSLDQVILTAEDFETIRNRHPGFSLILKSIFVQHSVLFVGYGGSDPHFEGIVEEISAGYNWGSGPDLPQCYILLHQTKHNRVVQAYKEKRRTHFILIDDYKDTPAFLKKLREACPRTPDGSP